MSYRSLTLALALVGLFYFGAVLHGYRDRAPFQAAAEYLAGSAEAADVLGAGVRIGAFPLGRMDEPGEEARLTLPVQGDDGRGRARIDLELVGGHWRVVEARLTGAGRSVALPAEDPETLKRGGVAVSRGYALYQSGRYEEAVRELRTAAAEDPANPEAQYWLGYVHEAMGDQEAALGAFLRAVELDPDDPSHHASLGVAYGRLGHLEESRASLDAAVALDPTSGRIYFSRAVTRSRLGDASGARRDLERACKREYRDACAALRGLP